MTWLQLTVIAIAALAALLLVKLAGDFQRRKALETYAVEMQVDHVEVKDRIESNLLHIYQGIRTLAALPGVRKIDRHANNIDSDTRVTFQQIYNNLAVNVAVSEVYIVPESLDPDRIDPVTGKPEEPILMFDSLIVNGAKQVASPENGAEKVLRPEMEIDEYRQYKEQFAWFRANVPDESRVKGLDVPMLSGPEIITCDNSYYNGTGNDTDRKGLSFAVPFYGEDGKLRGSVVAVVLSRELAAMLPSESHSLVHTGYSYVSPVGESGQPRLSFDWVQKGEADPSLLFSRAEDLAIPDGRGTWKLWTGHSNAAFWNRQAVKELAVYERIAIAAIGILSLLALGLTRLIGRNRALQVQMHAERFNVLGEITSKISHELRNPLGAMRNSAFMIRRLATSDGGIQQQVDRVERGIERCDRLIADLLDYTRRDELIRRPVECCEFIEKLVARQTFPGTADITVLLPENDIHIMADSELLGRAITNIIDNAAAAITDSGTGGRINVSCKMDGGRLNVAIADDGPGMAPEVVQQIFKPLFTTKSFAAGLGLPIAKDIIERHGGTVTVNSVVGQGTTFTILLPGANEFEHSLAA